MDENLRISLEMMGYRKLPNADRPIWAKPICYSILIFDSANGEIALHTTGKESGNAIVWDSIPFRP